MKNTAGASLAEPGAGPRAYAESDRASIPLVADALVKPLSVSMALLALQTGALLSSLF
jgi:hypothetical protein